MTEQIKDANGDFWTFWTDANGDWWWRHEDGHNHKTIGGSTEGYKNRGDCVSNAKRNGYVEKTS
jgi:uncharacterized protein YegP (UPF0339 family)